MSCANSGCVRPPLRPRGRARAKRAHLLQLLTVARSPLQFVLRPGRVSRLALRPVHELVRRVHVGLRPAEAVPQLVRLAAQRVPLLAQRLQLGPVLLVARPQRLHRALGRRCRTD